MTVINTNVKSLISQNALIRNNRAVETAMEQLSTGKRINSASDDATGMAISNRMSSQIRGLDQAVRNANDGISLIQTVEGSLNEVNNMLQRMRELSIQSANDTNTVEDRGFLDMEFQQLKDEINRVAKNTQWNGMDVLNKSSNAGNGDGKFEFQVGANANQLISIQLQDFRTEGAASSQMPAGTTNAQVSTLTLDGAYAAGDEIKLDIAFGTTTKSFTYEVQAEDLNLTGSGDLSTLAKIARAIVSDPAIEETLGLTLSSGAAGKIEFTGPAGVSFTTQVTSTIAGGGKATLGTETAGTPTAREARSIDLTGDYKAGDVITLTNGANEFKYTVTSSDAGTANLSTLASNVAAAASGNLVNTTAAFTAATADTPANPSANPPTLLIPGTPAKVTFTATSVGAGELDLGVSVQNASNNFDTAPYVKPAGSLNMIAQSNLTTRTDAQAAIENLDDAIAVISESRANMGAVMNRLTFAADNLINVAQNSTESRSRILDADFAKASSELARTQIISQAATSVLAQANQSQQSVMKLLQG
jgi:flagellin